MHGEYRHLSLHAGLAKLVGMPEENIFVLEDGVVLELGPDSAKIAGKVSSGHVYVDGLSVGDVGGVVLRDRKMLSKDGIVVAIVAINRQTGKLVGRPDIITRGFVDIIEFKDMLDKGCDLLAETIDHSGGRAVEWSFINTKVRDTLERYFYDQTKRRPMILPFMVKV